MTIITFQGQEVEPNLVLPMTQDLIAKDLFKNILNGTLTRKPYQTLLAKMKLNLKYGSFETKYRDVKDVIADTVTSKSISSYQDAMSHLKKLGMIMNHRGSIHLNPLVETRSSSKIYAQVIGYYNILWSEEFKRSVHIKYGDFSFTLCPLGEIQTLIATHQHNLLSNDAILSHLTAEQVENIAFFYSKNQLASAEILHDLKIDINDCHHLITLKAKMSKTYTNLGYNCMKKIAEVHFEIIKEQLPILFEVKENTNSSRNYSFCKLPLKWKCISFKETKFYKDAIALQQLTSECY